MQSKSLRIFFKSLSGALKTSLSLALSLSILGLPNLCAPQAQAQSQAQYLAQRNYDDDNNDDDRDDPRRDDSQSSNSSAQSKTSTKLFVPAFVTYWTHDALGYHPSICFNVENVSGTSLLGQPVQLQAHFRLLSEGILTIYRWTATFDTIGGMQQVNTEAHGKRPFELPMDQSDWPLIECKILCKLSDNTEVQKLLIARIQPVAMTDDDARNQLNYLLGKNKLAKAKMEQQRKKDALAAKANAAANPNTNSGQNSHPSQTAPKKPNGSNQSQPGGSGNNFNGTGGSGSGGGLENSRPTRPPLPETPLTAVAGAMPGTGPISTSIQPPRSGNSSGGDSAPSGSAVEALTNKNTNLPGLGDDFYLFEKILGLPLETDVRDKNWVFASYKKSPLMRIYAGSKGRTGKADVVLCVLKQDHISDGQLPAACRALAGKFKSEKCTTPEHSVRYVDSSVSPTGRLEFVTVNGQSWRGLAFKMRDTDGSPAVLIGVSRIPGALIELLKEEGHKTGILSFLLPGLGDMPKNDQYDPSRPSRSYYQPPVNKDDDDN